MMCHSHIALFLVRILLGFTFLLHGSQKVLGLFGGPGLSGFASWIGSLGISPILGYCAAFFELIAGILLVLGIASELGALLIIPVMVVAIENPDAFFDQKAEYAER